MRPTSVATSPVCPGAARGKKVLTVIAVETSTGRGLGRTRNRSDRRRLGGLAGPVHHRDIARGSTVVTDAWNGYQGLEALGYRHDRRRQRAARTPGDDPNELLPGVDRVASLLKRWLWAPTKARSSLRICRPTSTSSSSGSTAAARTVVGCCATAS